MPRYADSDKEKVREAVDMVDLVSKRTELRRAGPGRYMGRCPFHEDAHASASANLLTGGFRCHACEARGDLVGFHMRRTGLAFKAAVADLLRAAR